MTKKQFLAYSLLGAVTGIVILPGVLQWLGLPFSFADILYWILGEPTPFNKALVGVGAGILLYFIGRSFHKGYKKAEK